MRALLWRVRRTLLRLVPRGPVLAVVSRFVEQYAKALPPQEGLRFVMALDQRLYPLQGKLAIAYGGGLHTKHRHMEYHDFFVERVSPGEQVLDIGCGVGAVAYSLAQRAGAIVVGIDLSQEAIAQAQSQHAHPNVRYIIGNALTDLPGETFDVVVLSNVLEHIQQRVAFLGSIRDRVSPGRFLLRVPLFERDWRVPLKAELGVDYRFDPTHYIEYTIKEFRDEINATGLTLAHLETRWGEIWAEARVDA